MTMSGTINTGDYSNLTSIDNFQQNYYAMTSKYKTYYYNISGHKVKIDNYMNKLIHVAGVSFNFETSDSSVKLVLKDSYQIYTLRSIDEVRAYLKRLKYTYIKSKELEKELNLQADFQ